MATRRVGVDAGRLAANTSGMLTPAEARCLLNWLSTRVERVADGGLVVASDHAHERALVATRLATARHLGLTVVPGTYLPPPKSREKSSEKGEQDTHPAAHLLHCAACALSYRSSHYHCCACHQVFRTGHSFERHASGSAGRCATPEQLRRRRLRIVEGVWRGEPPRSLAG